MASLLTEAILTLSNFCGTKVTTSPNDSEPYLQNTMPQCLKQKGSKLQFITRVFIALKTRKMCWFYNFATEIQNKNYLTTKSGWINTSQIIHLQFKFQHFRVSTLLKSAQKRKKIEGVRGVSTALPPQTARIFIATVHQFLLFILIRLQNIVPT